MKQTLNEQSGITGKVKITAVKDGQVVYRQEYNNLVVSGSGGYGKNIVARRLASDNTYTLNLKYADLGTGTNAPTLADTALQTAVARASVVSNQSVADNVATINFFFSDAGLPNNTYTEFGTFVDGTSSVGSGRLFNRLIFGSPYTKTTGTDTTIEVTFTVN